MSGKGIKGSSGSKGGNSKGGSMYSDPRLAAARAASAPYSSGQYGSTWQNGGHGSYTYSPSTRTSVSHVASKGTKK